MAFSLAIHARCVAGSVCLPLAQGVPLRFGLWRGGREGRVGLARGRRGGQVWLPALRVLGCGAGHGQDRGEGIETTWRSGDRSGLGDGGLRAGLVARPPGSGVRGTGRIGERGSKRLGIQEIGRGLEMWVSGQVWLPALWVSSARAPHSPRSHVPQTSRYRSHPCWPHTLPERMRAVAVLVAPLSFRETLPERTRPATLTLPDPS